MIDGKYTLGATLGSGGTAKVKIAKDQNNSDVAIKIFDLNHSEVDLILQMVSNEFNATSEMHHRNIVKYYEFHQNASYVRPDNTEKKVAYIAMEPVLGGELYDYISVCGPFSERLSRYFFKQLLMGLHYLHSHGVCHRDLKPQNILVSDDHILKIADFGFVTPIMGRFGDGFNSTTLGTPGYMAPELINRCPYQSTVIDLFAAGVILFNLMTN